MCKYCGCFLFTRYMGLTFGFLDERCKRLQRKFWYPIIKVYISFWTQSIWHKFQYIQQHTTWRDRWGRNKQGHQGQGWFAGENLGHDATNKWIWTVVDKVVYFNSCKALCGYDPQAPPCSQRMAAQPAYREWQHSPHTERQSRGSLGHVPLGESIHPPRDDHTPRIQKICHTRDANGARNNGRGLTFSISCEVWQRISVSHRVQHMWLIPFVSSMVSLSQTYPPFSININYARASWGRYMG